MKTETLRATLLALPVVALAATPPAATQTDTVGTRDGSTITVQVLRDSTPVRGLSATDFEVRVKGKPVEVLSVAEVDFTATASGPGPDALPVAARRHVFLVFDLSFSTPASLNRAQTLASEFVARALQPSDLIAVLSHGGDGLAIDSWPTGDRSQVAAAIDALGGGGSLSLGLPSEREASPVLNADFLVEAQVARSDLRKGIAQNQQGRIMALTRSLAGVADLLRIVDGPAYVLFFSEGFDTSVILGNQRTRELDRVRATANAEAAASGELWQVEADGRYDSGRVETALFETLEEFRRLGRAIEAIDIRPGLPGRPELGGGQGLDGLYVIAKETRGGLLRNADELVDALEPKLDRTEVSYLLTLEPANKGKGKPKARYRRLSVELKEPLPEAEVIHPPGFYETSGSQAEG